MPMIQKTNIVTRIAILPDATQYPKLVRNAKTYGFTIEKRYDFYDNIFNCISSDWQAYDQSKQKLDWLFMPEPNKSEAWFENNLEIIARYGGCNLVTELMAQIYQTPSYMVYHDYTYFDDEDGSTLQEQKEDYERIKDQNNSKPIQHAYFTDDTGHIADLFNTFDKDELNDNPRFPENEHVFDPRPVKTLQPADWHEINVSNKNKYATNSWSDLLEPNEQIVIIDKLIELSQTKPWLEAGDYPETTN